MKLLPVVLAVKRSQSDPHSTYIRRTYITRRVYRLLLAQLNGVQSAVVGDVAGADSEAVAFLATEWCIE